MGQRAGRRGSAVGVTQEAGSAWLKDCRWLGPTGEGGTRREKGYSPLLLYAERSTF